MKILIADDEYIIREGLSSWNWESIGLRVCGIAKDGLEAIEIAREKHPDIILCDIRMPKMDGISAAEQLIKENPQCAVIFLSGYKDFEYAKRALAMGAFDYLLKPTDPEEIYECCKRAVEAVEQKKKLQLSIAEMKEKLKVFSLEQKKEEAPPHVPEGCVKRVTQILHYIDRHYTEDISLQSLSEEFHFNPIYLNRMLKNETGCTFLEIVTSKRMNRAAELLRTTDLKISEAAETVGIKDQRYFSQIFKKTFSCTPMQYRKAKQG